VSSHDHLLWRKVPVVIPTLSRYLLARSINAKNIVEVGTSFGVSTIYLALAVSQNVKTSSGANGKVIGTEKDQSKAARARKHWAEAGDEITKYIELREGDLIETLNVEDGMPEKVDLVLLDSVFPNLFCLCGMHTA
jgi:predicted O-methyltransferase YrrM